MVAWKRNLYFTMGVLVGKKKNKGIKPNTKYDIPLGNKKHNLMAIYCNNTIKTQQVMAEYFQEHVGIQKLQVADKGMTDVLMQHFYGLIYTYKKLG